MKLKIQGREYPAVTPQTAELLYLMELKQQSKPYSDDGKGWGMTALGKVGAAAVEAAKRGEEDADTALMWMGIIGFLSRRASGEEITFRDALRVTLDQIEVVPEPGDETLEQGEAEADPTVAAPAGPGTPAADPDPAPDLTPAV